MTAGALTLVTTVANTPFVLQVGGRNATGKHPVGDQYAPHISEVGDGSPSQMDFWIEDTDGTFTVRIGDEVRLTDRRDSASDTLFGGHLVNVEMTRRDSGYGRMLHCTAVGYDAWLDWRIVGAYARWSSKTKKANGQVTQISSDRTMVQHIINKFVGFLRAPDQTVQNTNTNMDVVVLDGVTARDGLDRIAETASTVSPEANRKFYVDRDGAVHYYQNYEGLTAPYRISDGSYTQTVLATSGLVALWEMDGDGDVVIDQKGGRHAALSGGYQRGTEAGIANESLARSTFLDGSSGYATTPIAAALHPGDTFSFECWFRRGRTLAREHLWGGPSNDLAIVIDATNHLCITKYASADIWVTSGTFTDTSSWHHLVATKSGSTRVIYVDGTARSASGTNATIVADATNVTNIGADFFGGERFRGYLQHVALYNVALSAATVLSHYQQGASIVAENLRYELDGTDGREQVYIAGGNDAGSGWVRPGIGNSVALRTAFGQDEHARQEIIERPDSKSVAKRNAYGAAFLKAHQDPKTGGSFTITGYGGWHVGQTVYITDGAYGLSGEPFEISQVDVDVLFGSGTIRYDITYGKPLRSGVRRLRRRRNRR